MRLLLFFIVLSSLTGCPKESEVSDMHYIFKDASEDLITQTMEMGNTSYDVLNDSDLKSIPNRELFTIPTPIVSDEQLRTPGIGFQESLSYFPSDTKLAACNYDTSLDSENENDIKSGSIYVRVMWQNIEPSDDTFAWDKLDKLFNCARQKGQTIDLRVMLSFPANDNLCDYPQYDDIPDCIHYKGLPKWLLARGIDAYDIEVFGSKITVPNWNNAILWEEHKELIKAIGTRYDGHPDLNSVDIGSVGAWGEWHLYGAFDDSGRGEQDFLPSIEQRKAIIDLYKNAFPTTPLIGLAEKFSNTEIANRLVNTGNHTSIGWRGDSWGIVGHHEDDYDGDIIANYPDLWKKGYVTLETTDVLESWENNHTQTDRYSKTLSIEKAVADALRYHASAIHNKANEIPEAYKSVIRKMGKKLGFRLILRSASYFDRVIRGKTLVVNMSWENVGVAPSYRDFRIGFRLIAANDERVTEDTTSASIRGRLPGNVFEIAPVFSIPSDLLAGEYTLETAIVFHSAIDRIVPIAIKGRTPDNWYPLGTIHLE